MRYFLFYILGCVMFVVRGQFYTLPNHWLFQPVQEHALLLEDTNRCISVYPLNPFVGQKFQNIDTGVRLFKYIKNDPALDILFEKDLVSVREKSLHIRVSPLLNFQKGQQTMDTAILGYTNTRGFVASIKLDRVYIETLLSESQSVFPGYLQVYSNSVQVVPGQGRWKSFKGSGFDYAFSAGLVSIQARNNMNVSFGTGKQKIGSGYRSLLLSDNSFVYPYIRIEQTWWRGRLQYECSYALLNNLTGASLKIPPNTERLFQKKPFVYQYLNVGIGKGTRLGFFQGIIGESPDMRNVWRGDGILFSPVLFSQWVYYGLHQKNNVLVGADIQQKIFRTCLLYGQLVIDDWGFIKEAYGYQLGMKWMKKWGIWRVMLLLEWNDVRNKTYMAPVFDNYNHSSYSHFNQNLAYTLGYGQEWLQMVSVKKSRWIVGAQYSAQQNTLFGQNLQYFRLLGGFTINPSYNLLINVGLENRITERNSQYIYIQLQTALYNYYYDF